MPFSLHAARLAARGRVRRRWLLASAVVLAPAHAGAQAVARSPSPPTVAQVIVTARPDPDEPPAVAAARERLSETPGAVAVVAQEAYEDRFALGLADVLRSVPGVVASKRYGEESRFSIRGSGVGNANHLRGVLLAQDGVPFNQADGFGDFQEVDPLSVRLAEVYKGGNALRFGGAALGGAVNFLTPTGRTAGFDRRFRLEAGSFETLRGHAAVAGERGAWDGYAALTATTAGGFRDQSDQTAARLTASVGRSLGLEREVRVVLQAGDIQQEVPGAMTLAQAERTPTFVSPANIAGDYGRDLRNARLTAQTRWRLNDAWTVEGAVYSVWKELYHPIPIVVDQESVNYGGFGRLDWEGALGGRRADLFAGVYLRSSDQEALVFTNRQGSRGVRTSDSFQQSRALDLFAEARLFVTERLALVAGGSYGRAERDYRDDLDARRSRERTYDWFAPRLGLLWEGDFGEQVYANVTRSVEPPNFGALVQPTVPGFVPLDVQEAWTAEIGTRGRRGGLVWDAALFRSEVEGELLNFVVGPDIPAATFNAGPTIHQGLEAALDWRTEALGGEVRLHQAYAYSDFRFDGDRRYGNNRLPVIPPHVYRAELRYTHPGGWFVGPLAEVNSEVAVDYANALKAPAFAVLGLNAGWSPRPGLQLFLDARNLLDRGYAANFTAVTDARVASTAVFYPGEPFSIFAGLRADF
jgi:iron complex outermembrane receptor protein